MKNNLEFTVKENEKTLKIINRQFDIDWDKVKTLDDVKSLLKGLQIHVFLCSETIPDHLKECFEKDFLIERKQ